MDDTSRPVRDRNTRTRRQPPLMRWFIAASAAMGIQIAAAIAAISAFAIVVAAAWSTIGHSSSSLPRYALFAIPVGLTAPALYVLSGSVASKLLCDKRGWWILLVGPLILVVARLAAVAF